MTGETPDIDRVVSETFVARAEYHPTLDSTNDRASRCAAEMPGELPLLIVAGRQTAGRGRGANRWWTGPDSLAMSLLLGPGPLTANRPSRSPLAALAAAVAVVETVEPLLPSHSVGLHWPNDVMAAGRKLAGILVEVLADGRQIVGIGMNTNNSLAEAPAELKETAVTLRELTGRRHDPTALLVDLLRHLQTVLERSAAAPERIAARADALCLQRDEVLTLQLHDRPIRGRCLGIAPDGALLLDTPQGRQAFYTGVLRHDVA